MVEDRFDSLMAFVDKAETGISTLKREDRASRAYDHDQWAGGSWQYCIDLAKSGWQDGAELIEAMAKPLLEQISSHIRKPEMVFAIEGDDIDIGTFMTGNPEPFLRWDETEVIADRAGKFVHVVCNISASCIFTTEELFAKGAAVAVVVDALELTGHRVTVDVCQMVSPSRYGSGNLDHYMLTVRLKNPDDPLNMEAIAFACAHSGMLRRLVFSVEEQQASNVVRHFGFMESSGYGRPEDPQSKIDCDIYIGASNSEMIREPMKWARRQLEAQGVEFNS